MMGDLMCNFLISFRVIFLDFFESLGNLLKYSPSCTFILLYFFFHLIIYLFLLKKRAISAFSCLSFLFFFIFFETTKHVPAIHPDRTVLPCPLIVASNGLFFQNSHSFWLSTSWQLSNLHNVSHFILFLPFPEPPHLNGA